MSIRVGMIPEFELNPFTRVLGAPPSFNERVAMLELEAPYSEAERKLSHDQRKYATLRLFEVSVPIRLQLQLVERINMAIRQGYKLRDPSRGWHRAQFLASSSALENILRRSTASQAEVKEEAEAWTGSGVIEKAVEESISRLPSLKGAGAHGFALIGLPGIGKSMVTEVTLDSIPQVVIPETPYYVKQLVHLKMDCPATPTRRQFCVAAFQAIDAALKTNYEAMFCKPKANAEEMGARLQNIVVLHAVGLIVIDEIQNVAVSPEGPQPFLNFFVGLVNRLGIPLMLIGTAEARPLLDGAFRQARRAAGLGQPNLDPLRRGEEWDDWLEEMWRYQWTATPTELTPEISASIYRECQGIVDIAVKLLLVTQLRAISRGEAGKPETLSAELFESVAKEEFASVRPMIQALREDRVDILATIPDLVPLQRHVDNLISRSMGMTAQEFRDLRAARQKAIEASGAGDSGSAASFTANVMQRGFSAEVAERVVAEAISSNAVDDIMGISSSIAKLLENAPRASRNRKKAPARKRPSPTRESEIEQIVEGHDDPLAALVAAGLAASSLSDTLPQA